MSSPRQRYTRLKTDDSDSFTNYVNEYNASQDQQDLLPPPPEFLGNSTVYYFIKKFGWWILALLFPYVFAPIFFIRKLYARSKRGYMAARYAHSEGYTDYMWTKLPMGLTQAIIHIIWVISGGRYDLTQFFERGVSSSPQRRYNLRRRNRESDSETVVYNIVDPAQYIFYKFLYTFS